jgi:hypothetical protein
MPQPRIADRARRRVAPVTRQEIKRLEGYLRKLFRLDAIEVRQRPTKDDSVEVYVGDEYIATIFRDPDDEQDYQFQMAILGIDLPES